MWYLTWRGKELHSLPQGDSGSHWTDRYCLCAPECEDYAEDSEVSLVVHNAWDGREKVERNEIFVDRNSYTLDWFSAVR